MTDAQPELRAVFCEALDQETPQEQAAYLDRACEGKPGMRARVEALLRAHAEAGGFLQEASSHLAATVDELPVRERLGTVIGPYKLLQQIGEGGMGTVFMAEQTHPVKRTVALKIIKPGMDSRQVIARFEAERQALALMEHPHIAKVLDAGTTDAGRPYFVMELVKGIPITRYCDEHHLTPRQRLELFLPVCQAVQHAHQKGIIHRDLKPSNTLVAEYDNQPVPTVIDFGVAKAAGPKLTERTLFTELGQIVGTLEYMSPEQAKLNALDIDTRSDIYALGVLLYELLTGTTPFEKKRLKQAAFDEVLRIIREEEPPRPSTRLSSAAELPSIAAKRGLEPKKLSGLVRGELDWIVMKCLEKDRNRRYGTANGLAHDIERYLHDEPVQAGPAGAGYRLRKFVRKYRTGLGIAGLFMTLLVLAAAVSTWQAVRAMRAEGQAVADRDRAKVSFHLARDSVDRFFTQVGESPKLKAKGMEKFRKELLRNAKEFYERFIKEQLDTPDVRHDLGLAHHRLGMIYRELGDYAAAQTSSEKAIDMLEKLAQAHPDEAKYQEDLANAQYRLGRIHHDAARMDKAEAAYQDALAIQQRLVGDFSEVADYRRFSAQTLVDLAYVHLRADRLEKAQVHQQQALAIWKQLVASDAHVLEDAYGLATAQKALGDTCRSRGCSEKAETMLKEAEHTYHTLVHDCPDVPLYWEGLGSTYLALGNLYHDNMSDATKAEAAHQQALQVFEKLVREHPDVLEYVYSVGHCYAALALAADLGGRMDTALSRNDKAIEILERVVSRGHGQGRTELYDTRAYRALVMLALRGDHARAIDEVSAVGQQEGLVAINFYNLACVCSQASAVVETDTKRSSADRTRLKGQYADRAMDFLRQALARGFGNATLLKSDKDLAPLRSREEFQKLVQALEQKANK
jgi:serine/threonine protein kinase/tetratricopeptide (TPR) repeat protein